MSSAIGNANGVDLNTADRQQLEQIGGIKGQRSENILNNRPFESWGDLKNKVPGFIDKMVEDLKNAGATIGTYR